MAVFGGYPQTVNYQTVNVSAGGGSENLLINPRGKINQANEASGVLTAGTYFCDGWKAGAAGAEVYIDSDGFRLISGSIVQLVPNSLEAGRTIRGNMDVVSGAPSISINGGGDNVASDSAEYIKFEVSGDNSKFTRLILAESNSLPIYQQSSDELEPCLLFLQPLTIGRLRSVPPDGSGLYLSRSFRRMYKVPAASIVSVNGIIGNVFVSTVGVDFLAIAYINSGTFDVVVAAMLDARP